MQANYKMVFAAATDAGNRYVKEHGLTKWNRAATLAATYEFNRICRDLKISPWRLPV